MNKTAPHYLLFTEAKNIANSSIRGGRWRFVLEQIGTANRIEEADDEPGVKGERLQLLAVVRGLEALEQESQVTLITSSKHVGRGIRRGLTQWRQNDWQWERFGQMALIKNHDLWKRIDHAMAIHKINCRVWQFDPPHVRTQVASEADAADLLGDKRHSQPAIVEPNSSDSVVEACMLQKPRFSEASLLGVDSAESAVETAADSAIQSVVGESLGRGNHLTLNLATEKSRLGSNFDHTSRTSSLLADKVKPIGQGKAFGYALASH
jgi:ribonuclease HI